MKHFQPGRKCGNCQSFRHSKGYVDSHTEKFIVTQKAGCAIDEDPKTCTEFKPRNKKNKGMRKRMKKWEHQFNY